MDELRAQVERWMVKADQDLHTARTMLSVDDPVPDIACYHSQQCAEKCLKAFLCLKEMDIPKTHDLVRLLQWCLGHDPSFEDLGQSLRELTDYAIETRYPDAYREIPLEEAEGAVEQAAAVKTFVRGKIDHPPRQSQSGAPESED